MNQVQKRIGTFFAIAFFAGGVVDLFACFYNSHQLDAHPISFILIPSIFGAAGLFLLTAIFPRLSFVQPVLFLLMVPFGFSDSLESFYGLGFFAAAVITLYRTNFFARHRILKSVTLLAYLYVVELYGALKSVRFTLSLYPVFFMTIFMLFLFITFREQIIIYLKAPKPRLSLCGRGLAPAECGYALCIAKGKTPKEIAFEFEVSESTVRNTLSRAYKKLGIEDKSGLIALAGEYELVD